MESSSFPPVDPAPHATLAAPPEATTKVAPPVDSPDAPSSLAPPVQAADTQAAQTPVGALAGAAPEHAELPPVTHSEPILTGGATGAAVERLVRLLAAAGYATNSVVKGENPYAVFDNTVMADVQRFWAEHHVEEPPELFEGRDVAAALESGKWVGPHTWQALIDHARELAGA